MATFESYIKELVTKYPSGSKIVAVDKEIRGKVLTGNPKLEIPESNKNAKNLHEVLKIAKKYNVEVVFEAE